MKIKGRIKKLHKLKASKRLAVKKKIKDKKEKELLDTTVDFDIEKLNEI